MKLPDEVVKLILASDEDIKLQLVRNMIPNYIPANIISCDNSRFRIELLGWSGVSSYVSTFAEPSKFQSWVISKHKKILLENELNWDKVKEYLNSGNVTENGLSVIFKGNHKLFKNTMMKLQSNIPADIISLIKHIIEKPSIFEWYTKTSAKLNKLGIKKLD